MLIFSHQLQALFARVAKQAGNNNHFCLSELQHLEMSVEAKRDISDQSVIDYTWLGI